MMLAAAVTAGMNVWKYLFGAKDLEPHNLEVETRKRIRTLASPSLLAAAERIWHTSIFGGVLRGVSEEDAPSYPKCCLKNYPKCCLRNYPLTGSFGGRCGTRRTRTSSRTRPCSSTSTSARTGPAGTCQQDTTLLDGRNRTQGVGLGTCQQDRAGSGVGAQGLGTGSGFGAQGFGPGVLGLGVEGQTPSAC